MNTLTETVIEAAQEVERIGIGRQLKEFHLQGGAVVARQAHNLKVAGSIPAPATNLSESRLVAPRESDRSSASKEGLPLAGPVPPLVLQQLLNLFELHCGGIPARELMAEGFNINQLEAWHLITRSRCTHDGDVWVTGSGLPLEIKKFSAV